MNKPYMIAEIGINHNGSLTTALDMIRKAKQLGFNCVKFQKRNPDICVPESQKSQFRKWLGKEMTYLEYKKAIEFEKAEYDVIDAFCREIGIAWSASIWDVDSLQFILQYDIPFVKIPSACVDNAEIITAVNQSGKPALISDGMLTTTEFIRVAKSYKNLFGVMHTNSTYPCDVAHLDLNVMDTYRSIAQHVGYSGHEEGYKPTTYAIAAGADIIERHITFDKAAEGSDHKASLDYDECEQIMSVISEMTQIFGGYYKDTLYPGEESVARRLKT